LSDTKSTYWKSLLPILIPAILSSGFVITGISTFFNEIFNKPALQIDIVPNNQDEFETDIVIKNNGKVMATNVTMVIVSQNIIDNYSNFTTEKIKIKKINDNILKVTIPKIVQGGGSLVSIKLITNNTVMPDIYEKYGIFLVYDQGSIYKSFKGSVNSVFVSIQEFWITILSNPIYMIIIGIIVFALSIIYLKLLRRIKIKRIRNYIDATRRRISWALEQGEPIDVERQDLDHLLEMLRNMKMKKEEFDQLNQSINNTIQRYCYINKVIRDGENIIVFGGNFGSEEGLVLINQNIVKIIFWSEKRINVYTNINIDENSLLRIIRNDGKEVSTKILDTPTKLIEPEPVESPK
jgi:uncharacterized membrane protein (DUF106 family)